MALRDLIRKMTPDFMLQAYRRKKRAQTRADLQAQKERGEVISKADLLQGLRQMGIVEGDTLLVHSALSKIGYVEGGPKTVIEALQEAVGKQGHVCMPSSPNPALQLEYVQNNPVFDRANDASKMGAITEVFRTSEGVVRSFHPTEPVCAWGPEAEWITEGHYGELTAYTSNSPFARVAQKNGKILYVGVTLINAGTSLHTLEDAVDFKYPVYHADTFEVRMVDNDGSESTVKTKVHNPVFSARRRCDELLPQFEAEGAMTRQQWGRASVLLFDASRMFEVMVEQYQKNGVTMYTPHGEDLQL